MENELNKPQIILGRKEDVDEMSETFKTFSGELKEHIAELKKSCEELFCIKDERQGIIVETQSKRFNVKQLKTMAMQSFKEILDLRKSLKPSYID